MLMNVKSLLFWVVLLVIPVVLWWMGKTDMIWFGEWYVTASTWGQVLGIAGLGLLAGNIILAGKWKFIDRWFGGLDKAYGLHRSSGKAATYLLTAHLALMTGRLWDGSWATIGNFVVNLSDTPTLYGKLAYIVLLGIVLITLFGRMEYEAKRRIHKLMGVAVLLAGLHVFFIPSDVAVNLPLRQYLITLITLALISYLIKTVIPKRWWLSPNFIVEEVKRVGEITEVTLNPIMGRRRFVPGQFAFYQFLTPGLNEVHPFTIAASTKEKAWKIDAKASGDFTRRLAKLPVGTRVMVDGPFGGFLKNVANKSVWVAGGIGITPFLSVLRTWYDNGTWEGKSVRLYYSVAEQEIPFIGELRQIEAASKGAVEVVVWKSGHQARLTGKDILREGSNYYICGPSSMIRGIRGQLRALGVTTPSIHSEEFRLF